MYVIKGIFLGVLIGGIITACAIAYPETIASIDFKYGNDINKFVHEVNDNIEITNNNCMNVTDTLYKVLKSRQCVDVYKMGIHGGEGLSHSLVKYNDKWGDPYLIFIYRIEGRLRLVNVPAGSEMLDKMFPTWNFYRIYSSDRKTWRTIHRVLR